MNFKKIFILQKKLDNKLREEHSFEVDDEHMKMRLIALSVELAEFINEISFFKYWKKNKNIDKKKALEEYADCLHFFCSFILLEDTINLENIIPNTLDNNLINIYSKILENIGQLSQQYNFQILLQTFELYLGMGELVGLTNKEVEDSYVEKNEINFSRIKNNY